MRNYSVDAINVFYNQNLGRQDERSLAILCYKYFASEISWCWFRKEVSYSPTSVPNKAEALFNDLSTVPQQDHMNIPSQSWLSKRCNLPVRANLTSILSSLVHKLLFSSKMYEFKASWGVQLIDRDRNVFIYSLFIYLWGGKWLL